MLITVIQIILALFLSITAGLALKANLNELPESLLDLPIWVLSMSGCILILSLLVLGLTLVFDSGLAGLHELLFNGKSHK